MMDVIASQQMIDQTKNNTNKTKSEIKCLCTFRQYILLIIVMISICFVTCSILIVKVVSLSNHSHEATIPECMKCSKLTRLIDRWAWKSNVQQHGEKCCFEEDYNLFASMKYYFEKRMDSDKSDIEQLRNTVNGLMFRLMENETVNGTLDPPVDFSRLIDLINQVFHRQRSILHLTSSQSVHTKQESMAIHWDTVIKQGIVSHNVPGHSVTVHTTALYFISVHIKFRATDTAKNLTEYTTIQFYLKKIVQNHPSDIETYKKDCVFHSKMAEYDAFVHTITRLDYGDELLIEVPRSQRKFLAPNTGAHRLLIFEIS